MYGNERNSGQLIGANAMVTQAEPSQPEVAREHAALRESVEFLGHVVSTLHDRLQPVVMQRPQAVGGTNQKESACSSLLGQSINAASAGVRNHADRLQELLQSLAI